MSDTTFLKDGEYTLFRGKPLVRDKNIICYGDMEKDAYVMLLLVTSVKKITLLDGQDCEIPDALMVQIYSTDTKKNAMERMVKMVPAKSFFEALDFGMEYLERMNKKAKA